MNGEIGLVALIGGILIAAAILYGIITNRRRSNASRRQTQDATANLYRQMDREDQASDPDPKRY